jgi:hypothetical protein
MNSIKNTITRILVTTCAALMLLALFVGIVWGSHMSINVITFFEIFAANIVIHLGHILVKKFESSYAILEYLLDLSYIIAVLVVFGLIFDWYSTIPVWYLIIMALVIYAFGTFINIVRMRKNADELNKLLKKYKDRNSSTVT